MLDYELSIVVAVVTFRQALTILNLTIIVCVCPFRYMWKHPSSCVVY